MGRVDPGQSAVAKRERGGYGHCAAAKRKMEFPPLRLRSGSGFRLQARATLTPAMRVNFAPEEGALDDNGNGVGTPPRMSAETGKWTCPFVRVAGLIRHAH
ncbi:MAG: hypothetical protein JWO20_2517 [Candidatus Angelobacter sp.]|jgi:hypothetical protein|nr:hypothetical protein [Candidatus Angelobacter sp.]